MLRTFGLGKLSFEPRILQELATVKTELLRLNDESGGAGVDLAPLIGNAVSNVICSMTLGQRFHHEDHEFHMLLGLMERGLEICVNSPAVLINIFPLLYYLPFGVFKELRQVERDITVFLKRIIAKHRETLDPENPRDLVDMYLKEILAQQASGQADSSFTDDYLFYIVGDLFIAGTDTTTNSVLWILLYMVLYPDIQGKSSNSLLSKTDTGVKLWDHHWQYLQSDSARFSSNYLFLLAVQKITIGLFAWVLINKGNKQRIKTTRYGHSHIFTN